MTKPRLFSLFICLLLVFTNPLLDEILFSIGSQMPFLQDGFSDNVYYADAVITLPSLVLYLLLWKRFLRGSPLPCSLEFSKKRIGASVLCSLGLSGISFLILLFVEHVLVPMGILTEAYEDFSTMWNGAEEAGYFWVCLSTVVIGPIFEEVLFRGLVYSMAEREFCGYTPAILSGILFGLWHGQPVQCACEPPSACERRPPASRRVPASAVRPPMISPLMPIRSRNSLLPSQETTVARVSSIGM